MRNELYSVTKALTPSVMMERAPAMFAESNHMSNRYIQVNTSEVVAWLHDSGFAPVNVRQDRARSRDPMAVRHEVILRHEGNLSQKKVGEVIPQITLINSHNGRTKLRMYMGMYRLVCLNGLVVGSNTCHYEAVHVSNIRAEIGMFATEASDNLSRAVGVIDSWRKIGLSASRQTEFAKQAAVLRFGSKSEAYDPAVLLTVRRTEDDGGSLWQTFNRLQENLTVGGLIGVSASGRAIQSRKLEAIEASVRFNRGIWDLAESFAA